jgi:hypothetical protein
LVPRPGPRSEGKQDDLKSRACQAAKEIARVKTQLQEMIDKVLCGELKRSDAVVRGQLLNVKVRTLEVERKIKETEQLEERI